MAILHIHVPSTKHEAKMNDTQKGNVNGDIIQKSEAAVNSNHKVGGLDSIHQELHSIQALRKTYKWYSMSFFKNSVMTLLSSHKL